MPILYNRGFIHMTTEEAAAHWPLKDGPWMPHLCPGEHCAVCRWDREREERHGEARTEATEAHEED